MHLSFSDYDHENERHVEVSVGPGLCVSIERRIEVNPDYLAPDAELPDEWEHSADVFFPDIDALKAFIRAYTALLIENCFMLYADGEEHGDDALERIETELTTLSLEPVSLPAIVESLADFPR